MGSVERVAVRRLADVRSGICLVAFEMRGTNYAMSNVNCRNGINNMYLDEYLCFMINMRRYNLIGMIIEPICVGFRSD